MDLKGYYRKLRKKGEEMPDGDQVVVSEATPDGGVAGVLSEVTKEMACRLVVEGRARLASEEEAEWFRLEQREAQEAWARSQAAQRIHVQLMNGLEREARADKQPRS
jgi:thiamine monophosphate synthase